MGPIIDGGPISQPTRQPVAANASGYSVKSGSLSKSNYSLPADKTVTVRSHMPGSVAKRTCSLPSKTRQSYWEVVLTKLLPTQTENIPLHLPLPEG